MARSPRVAAIGAVVLLAGSGAGYFALGAVGEPDQPLAQRLALANEMRENRPSQTELVAAAPEPAPVDAPEEYLASIEQLRQIVPTRPNDLRGWELLAFHETELRNYSAAVAAQQRVMELKPDITPEDQRLLVDLMVAAADGYVSPETEVIVREMLAENEGNITGLYYLGALYNQTDRPDLAFRFWRPLVDSGEDTFHIALARAQIENAAARAGIEYSVPSFAGPDLDQITDAEGMSAEDRAAMIGDMVGRLSDRLATEGGPPVEWARLIRAYGVLGQTDDARTVWLEAQEVFGTSEDAMATLTEAASSAGLLE